LKRYIFIVLVLLDQTVSAQLLKPIFKEGEFNGTFYQNSRDRLGYVWISTDQGVYRWDSKNLEHFTTAEGLPSNEVFRCYMDSKERVWMTFYNGEICYHYRGKIYNKENDKRLTKLGKVYHGAIIEHNNSLYLSKLNGNYFSSHLDYKSIVLGKNDTIRYYNNYFTLGLGQINNELYYSNDFRSTISLSSGNQLKIRKKDTFYYILNHDKTTYLHSILKEVINKKRDTWQLIISNFIDKDIIGFKNEKPYYLDNFSIYTILNNQKQLLYTDSALEINRSMTSTPPIFFNNKRQQGYYSHLERLEKVKRLKKSSDILSIFTYKNQIWLYEQKKGLTNLITKETIRLQSNAGKFYNLSLNNNKLAIFHAIKFYNVDIQKRKVYIPTERAYVIDTIFQKPLKRTFDNIGLKKGVWYKELIYIGTFAGVLRYMHNNNNNNNKFTLIHKGLFNSVFLDKNKRFWLSTPEGILYTHQYEPKIENLKKLNLNTNVSVQVQDFKEDAYGNLLMATNDGVYIVDQNLLVTKLQIKNGLTSNDCKKIHLDNDGSLWVVTNLGVNHLHYWNQGRLKPIRINYLLKTDGLQSNNIRDLAILGDSLYILSDKGLDMVVDKHWQPSPEKIPIHINRLFIAGKKLDSIQLPVLEHHQNSLQIDFSAIYYDRTDRLKVFYRLIASGDTIVQEVQDRSILLQALAPNDYQLQIFAYDQDYPEIIRGEYKELRIKIRPPFYKTWWFIGLNLLLAIFVLGGIAYVYYRRETEKQENEILRNRLEKNLSRLKLEALKAEMNPHFIFNCLNSIKDFIIRNESEKSQYYLSQLSKLIRIALYNTKEEFISLRSELEFIELYVSLEQLRFQNQFEYTLDVQNPELLNAEIPTMVLQPFFENAIRHGKIGQLEAQKGQIKLTISVEGEEIVFKILDNGIGIEEAQRLKSKSNANHKSMALNIIKDRITIYNQSFDLAMQFKMETCIDSVYTTLVEIRYILD